jgi:hypothetical protein
MASGSRPVRFYPLRSDKIADPRSNFDSKSVVDSNRPSATGGFRLGDVGVAGPWALGPKTGHALTSRDKQPPRPRPRVGTPHFPAPPAAPDVTVRHPRRPRARGRTFAGGRAGRDFGPLFQEGQWRRTADPRKPEISPNCHTSTSRLAQRLRHGRTIASAR